MPLGKKLLAIVIVKLIIIFAVLRIFFFQDYLDSKFNSDADKANFVANQLTNNK
jgi:hypothetical protein